MAASNQQVLEHHLKAFSASDIEGILQDYGDQALIVLPDGSVLHSKAQLKPVFEAFFAEFAKPGASFQMGATTVEGEIAFITWSAETADNSYEYGTDTFVIRDGKIVVQTMGIKATSKK